MKAMVIVEPGGPEVLHLRDVPEPRPGPDEVRVRVRATALNRADLLQRRGRYPAPPGSPRDIPGLEFAGEVAACGARVSMWNEGDRVMGIVGGGSYAEGLVVHERLCMPVPAVLDWTQAAAVPEAFLTAFDALFVRGRLSAGESLLVHAASSGVGTAACQLAGLAGATPIGLSRGTDKHEALRRLGVPHVLDATRTDLVRAVRSIAERGVDLVLQLVGGSSLGRDLELLAPLGRIVLVGLMGGARVELDLSRLLSARATLIGTVLRARPIEEKIDLTRRFARQVLPRFEEGRLHPLVDRTLDLEDAGHAHDLMERNTHVGKIVLRVP